MIDGSEKRNRQLAFELQNSHVCENRSNIAYPSNVKTCIIFHYFVLQHWKKYNNVQAFRGRSLIEVTTHIAKEPLRPPGNHLNWSPLLPGQRGLSVLNLNLSHNDGKHWSISGEGFLFSFKSMALLDFKVQNLPEEGILQDSL